MKVIHLMKPINLIVAFNNNYGISFKNKIPWHNPHDMQRFKEKTTNNIVIYGKNTFLDLPIKFRCLKDRYNIIISTTLTDEFVANNNKTQAPFKICPTVSSAINFANSIQNFGEIWICGGSAIYEECIRRNIIDKYFVTVQKDNTICDNYFPFLLFEDNVKTFRKNIIYECEKYMFVDYIRLL